MLCSQTVKLNPCCKIKWLLDALLWICEAALTCP